MVGHDHDKCWNYNCLFLRTTYNIQSYGFFSSHIRLWELDHKEGWAPKNWCFQLWCWRRLLRVPSTSRSKESILKEINPEYSLWGLMLKLKLQYFGHLISKTDSFVKTLVLAKIEGGQRRGWQKMRWLEGITDSVDMVLGRLGVGDGQGGLVCCSSWGCRESDTTERLN